MDTRLTHSDRLDRDFEFNVVHIGLTDHAFGDKDDDHLMDQWMISIADKVGGHVERFDYYTGLGHREIKKAGHDAWMQDQVAKLLRGAKMDDPALKRHRITDGSKAILPKLDDILSCLLSHSYAVGMTFEDWCGDYGYDTDSRKALATYEACQKIAGQLKRIGITDLEAARDKFNDY